jgi:hypothetical protein
MLRARRKRTKKDEARTHGLGWEVSDGFSVDQAGMARGEIEKRFAMDGGLQSVSTVRFTHPECGYFKIDVEFDFKRDEKEQGRAIWSPGDKATKVSRPYIEAPCMD